MPLVYCRFSLRIVWRKKKKKKMPAQLNRRVKDAIRNKKASFKNLKCYPKKKKIESGISVG